MFFGREIDHHLVKFCVSYPAVIRELTDGADTYNFQLFNIITQDTKTETNLIIFII